MTTNLIRLVNYFTNILIIVFMKDKKTCIILKKTKGPETRNSVIDLKRCLRLCLSTGKFSVIVSTEVADNTYHLYT